MTERAHLRVVAAQRAGELVFVHRFRGTASEARCEVSRLWPRLSRGEVSLVVLALSFGETNGLRLPRGHPRIYGAPRK